MSVAVPIPAQPTADAAAEATGSAPAASEAEAMMERVFEASIAAQDVATIHIGRKLRLYDALRDRGALTSVELAEATGTDERYVREWLEHQAVGAFLTVDDVAAAPRERRYTLPAGHAEALTDHTSEYSVGPFAQFVIGEIMAIEPVIDAFRTGAGVPWEAFPESRLGQGEVNRPMFTHELGSKWIPALAERHAQFTETGGRVADIACGTGWSSIEMARAYPRVSVDGYDPDVPSIELARENVAGSGVEDRVEFHAADGAAVDGGSYDLVTIFEAVHDMARPVEVLAGARRLVTPDGEVLVADEKVAETFTAPGDDVERVMYGFSVLCCLPTGRAEHGSACTGTAIRPETMERYAREAGFSSVEILDIENDLWRFYRLLP